MGGAQNPTEYGAFATPPWPITTRATIPAATNILVRYDLKTHDALAGYWFISAWAIPANPHTTNAIVTLFIDISIISKSPIYFFGEL